MALPLYSPQGLTRYETGYGSQAAIDKWSRTSSVFPIVDDLDAGYQEIAIMQIAEQGQAEFFRGDPSNVPLISHTMTGYKYGVKALILGFYRDMFQKAAERLYNQASGAMFSQIDTDALCRQTIRNRIQYKEHITWVFGSPDYEMQGIASNLGSPVIDEADALHGLTTLDLHQRIKGFLKIFQKHAHSRRRL